MAERGPSDGEMGLLVYLLAGSFVLMLLSGVFYGLGLPETWARALFIATLLVWITIGVAVIVEGQLETRAIARVRGPVGVPETAAKGEGGEEDEG